MTNPKFCQVGHASQRGLIERNGTVYEIQTGREVEGGNDGNVSKRRQTRHLGYRCVSFLLSRIFLY